MCVQLDSSVLKKIETNEQKTALFVRKHHATRLLRIKHQEQNKRLMDQIRALEGEVEELEDADDIARLQSDDEMDSSLHLLLELPEPSAGT